MSEPATPTPEAGTEHDAWLREALRHAPDASAAPPLSLREAILAEARAATRAGPRTAPPPSFAERFAEFWSWLARPPVAAGFASVMAATLVGLMWWDRPLDEMAPPRPEPVVAAPAPEAVRPTPAPAAAAPVTDQAAATTLAAPPNAPAEALRPSANARPATAEHAPPAERAPPADRAERERRGFAAPKARPPAAVAATPEKAKTAVDALGEGRKDADSRTANATPARPAAPAPVAAPAATTAPAAPNVSTPPSPFPARDARESDTQAPAQPLSQTPSRAEPAALAKKAGKAEQSDAEEKPQNAVAQNRVPAAAAPAPAGAAATGALEPSTGASSDGGVAANRFAAAPRPAPVARQRAAESASTTARPMAPLLAALSSEGGRWSRLASASETAGADAATQAWLARVDAAASQWQPVSERLSRLDAGSASRADTSTMLLYREGRVAAIVRVDDAGVYFEARPGSTFFAPLAPDVVARLRATLPAAKR